MKQEFVLQTALTFTLNHYAIVSVIIIVIPNGFIRMLALFLLLLLLLLLLLIDISTHYVPSTALSTQHILFH